MMKTVTLGTYWHRINREQRVHMPMTGIVYRVEEVSFNKVMVRLMDAELKGTDTKFHIGISDLSPIEMTKEWADRLKLKTERLYDINTRKFYDEFHIKLISGEALVCAQNRGFQIVGKYIDEEVVLHGDGYVHEWQNLYFYLTGNIL